MYNVIHKIMEDENMKKEEMNRILESSNAQELDTTKLYLGHVVFVDNSMQISNVDEPFRIFSDLSLSFVGNHMFWDVINQEVFGDINGSNGDLLPGERNTGFCVDNIQVLYEVTKKQRMTLEELNLFIESYNKNDDEEIFIRFVFSQKEDRIWCKKGFEVCFDQIKLKNKDRKV